MDVTNMGVMQIILSVIGVTGSLTLIFKYFLQNVADKVADLDKKMDAHEKKVDTHLSNIYNRLGDINGRVTRTEVDLTNHKDHARNIQDRDKSEIDRRLLDIIKDVEHLKAIGK